MTRYLLALLAATAAVPAVAQHAGHRGHQQTPPSVQEPVADPHAGHQAEQPTPTPPPASGCTAAHAAMGHCGLPTQQPADPHAGHEEAPEPTPTSSPSPACTAEHAAMGHCTLTPQQLSDPHAGHTMLENDAPPIAPPPAAARSGPENAADTVFGAEAMAPSRRELIKTHGRMATSRLRIERLESGFGEGEETYDWEVDFFYGEPFDRLWLKTEGEGAFGGDLERGEIQALWGHAIAPFFDLQAGLRYDFSPDPERVHIVLGVQGLAPYWIEIDAAAFISDEGEMTARIEAEHDMRITQRLILQPLVEINLSSQDIPGLAVGAGLGTSELGLRLRYEITPEFAPYAGAVWEQAYGDTADFREAAGEDRSVLRFVAGLRMWF